MGEESSQTFANVQKIFHRKDLLFGAIRAKCPPALCALDH